MKNVQIPYELFFKIIKYHLLDMYDESEEIKKGLVVLCQDLVQIKMRGSAS